MMTETELLVRRAARTLSRPGAWLHADGGGYVVRCGADRRRRALLRLDEGVFTALVQTVDLKPVGEGWRLARALALSQASSAGRPGYLAGEKMIVEPNGRTSHKAANLGESPIAWLARRKDSKGRPWLSVSEIQAGERLREDFYRAGTLGRLTMSWDPRPSAGSGRSLAPEPAEQGRAAKARIARALAAVGPGLKEILERVCLAQTALEAAERDLGLPRRSGKTVLKLALTRLAAHYAGA